MPHMACRPQLTLVFGYRLAVATRVIRDEPSIHSLFPDLSWPQALQTSGRFLATLHHQSELRRPTRPLLLRATLQRQGARGHILGDDAARSDIGALADLHRGYQGGVGAYERAPAHLGRVLGVAIVVAEDGAGANVGAFPDPAVAEVGQMVGLGTCLHR